MSKTSAIVRFLVCGLVAAAVIVLGGGWLIHRFLGNEPEQVLSVKVARGITLIHSIPGLDNSPKKDSKTQSERMVPGFVQLAYTIGEDGRAHDIRVLHAVPEGVYERAAQAVVAARHFTPSDSRLTATVEHTQTVHFRVPASELKHKGKGGAAGNSDD